MPRYVRPSTCDWCGNAFEEGLKSKWHACSSKCKRALVKQANPEAVAAGKRAWGQANRDKMRKASSNWHANNKEAHRAMQARYDASAEGLAKAAEARERRTGREPTSVSLLDQVKLSEKKRSTIQAVLSKINDGCKNAVFVDTEISQLKDQNEPKWLGQLTAFKRVGGKWVGWTWESKAFTKNHAISKRKKKQTEAKTPTSDADLARLKARLGPTIKDSTVIYYASNGCDQLRIENLFEEDELDELNVSFFDVERGIIFKVADSWTEDEGALKVGTFGLSQLVRDLTMVHRQEKEASPRPIKRVVDWDKFAKDDKGGFVYKSQPDTAFLMQVFFFFVHVGKGKPLSTEDGGSLVIG